MEKDAHKTAKELTKMTAERDDLRSEANRNNERFAAATQRILESDDSTAVVYLSLQLSLVYMMA